MQQKHCYLLLLDKYECLVKYVKQLARYGLTTISSENRTSDGTRAVQILLRKNRLTPTQKLFLIDGDIQWLPLDLSQTQKNNINRIIRISEYTKNHNIRINVSFIKVSSNKSISNLHILYIYGIHQDTNFHQDLINCSFYLQRNNILSKCCIRILNNSIRV